MAKPLPAPRQDEWAYGLCDCCAAPGGCSLCCKTACCSCMAIADILEHLPPGVVMDSGPGNSACIKYFLVAAVINSFSGFGGIVSDAMWTMPTRAMLYPVNKDKGNNCFVSLCCSCCAMIQMRNEISIREAAGFPAVQQPMMMGVPGMMVMQQPVMPGYPAAQKP